MEIRNLMEDLVQATVAELFASQAKGAAQGFCTCDQCRLDVACFVLNRLKPEYVVSGRGVAYTEQDYVEKLQKTADVVSLVREGWAKINSSPRPYHVGEACCKDYELPKGPLFNLPPLMGRLFNGNTFEPIASGALRLEADGAPARMMDAHWQNPYPLVPNTAGTFIFWPLPVAAGAVGEERTFSFMIAGEFDGFEPLGHYVELRLVAEAEAVNSFSLAHVHKLGDLYLFPA